MSIISLRLPESLHKKVREAPEREHISIRQSISTALAERLSALLTGGYLAARAKRGSRARFDRALGIVPERKPDPEDEAWIGAVLATWARGWARFRIQRLTQRIQLRA